MDSPREAALKAMVDSINSKLDWGATISRNEALSERINPSGHVIVYDGQGEPEILVGCQPPEYSWLWTSEVVIVTASADTTYREEQNEKILELVGTTIRDDPYLGNSFNGRAQITGVDRDQAVQLAEGSPPVSVSVVEVTLDYVTNLPTG